MPQASRVNLFSSRVILFRLIYEWKSVTRGEKTLILETILLTDDTFLTTQGTFPAHF